MKWISWEWTKTHVNSHCLWPWWPGCSLQAGVLCHGTKHPHTWPRSCRSWRRIISNVESLQPQSLARSHEVSQHLNDHVHELKNVCCFVSTLQITPDSLPVAHHNWNHKGNSGNVVQPSQSCHIIKSLHILINFPSAHSLAPIFLEYFTIFVTSFCTWPSNYCLPYVFSLWLRHLSYQRHHIVNLRINEPQNKFWHIDLFYASYIACCQLFLFYSQILLYISS